ncbi:MAG: DUF3971 domain-containing protein [Rhodobacterales bacterium]|nr:DUF3971 domain-containing protein [Rhodobacterales bacterium]
MTEAEPDTPAPTRHRLRLGWRWVIRFSFLLLIVPIITPIVVGVMMIGQQITAPSWIRERVEESAATVLEGGNLQFGAITVEMRSDMHPVVHLTDAVLRDAQDIVFARVPEIEVRLSPRGLLFRRSVLVQEITLRGAQIALRRDEDGTLAFAFDTGGSAPVGQAAGFVGLLEQFDQAFERPALEALEGVHVEGLIINFDDGRAGRNWTVDGGALNLDLQGGVTRLTGDMSLLSGRSFVTRVSLSYESPRGSPAAKIGMTVSDAAASDIAMQSPALSFLKVLDAPISAAFRVEIDDQGKLGPLSAALKIAAGALAPQAGAKPVGFDMARVYLSYDPQTGALNFDQIEVKSDWGALRAEGQAYLREVTGGWPAALLGQFTLTEISLNPLGLYPSILQFPGAFVDFRLRLDPFSVTFGNIAISDSPVLEGTPAPGQILATGDIAATPEGWDIALDVGVDHMSTERVMELWPLRFRPFTRVWFAENVWGGELFNVNAAFRSRPGQPRQLAITHEYRDMTVRPLRWEPPITGAAGHVEFMDDGYMLALDRGTMTPPQGGEMDVGGSVLKIPDTRHPSPLSIIRIRSDSSITAALSVMDQRPFFYMQAAGLAVDTADGRAVVQGEIRLPLGGVTGPGMVDYDIQASLTDVRTEDLVPGRVIAASELAVQVDNSGVQISGPMTVGIVPADMVWRQDFGPEGLGGSVLTADVELSERFIDEFNIGLPDSSVSGAGTGQLRLSLPPGGPPAFTMTSDLTGLRMQLPSLAWAKGANTAGNFSVSGTLGPVPDISEISFNAGGLRAVGSISITPAGFLDRATFDRVRLNGWLDAPVTFVGRGDRPAAIEIGGGTLDFTRAEFGESGEEGGPMTVALDRLQISETIALTDMQASFEPGRELVGTFTARVNGGQRVEGDVNPSRHGSAVRVQSDDAGAVLRSADLFTTAEGGSFFLSLVPAAAESTYDGDLRIEGLRLRDAPALASLLNAVSVLGALQQLSGQGLVFDEVQADFQIDPQKITVTRSSATGVGLGISLDGIYTLATKNMDFQGVLSPFYLLNSVGEVLTRRGEGLIGFNFNLEGPYDTYEIKVNPLSVLTPGMFREIFRRPPPEIAQ